jgi:hypothetical protein
MTTAIIRLVVLVVVILGIASVMVVSVVQKNREIDILRAIGATQGQILRIFLLQGAMVSLTFAALWRLSCLHDAPQLSIPPKPYGYEVEHATHRTIRRQKILQPGLAKRSRSSTRYFVKS